ncbi:hypothetical protein GCM10027612_46900 [Microbispora bryophytorum subsp. camponoti]
MTPAPGDQPALGGPPLRERLRQPCLADPRLTGDHRDARPALCHASGRLDHVPRQLVEPVALRPPADRAPLRPVRPRRFSPWCFGPCRFGLCCFDWRRPALPHGGGAVEGRVLGEDRLLQASQRRSGVEAELLGQVAPGRAQRLQCVRLPAQGVERAGEQLPQPLAQGMGGHQGLQLAHHVRVAHPPGQEPFPRHQMRFGEPLDLRPQPGHVAELLVRRAAPQGQGAFRLAGLGQADEVVGVHLVRPERIARRAAEEHGRGRARSAAGFEHPAQVGDVAVQRALGARRRRAVVQVVEDRVHRHGRAPGDQQTGDQQPGPRPAEVDGNAVDVRLDRAEYSEHDRHAGIVPRSSAETELSGPQRRGLRPTATRS